MPAGIGYGPSVGDLGVGGQSLNNSRALQSPQGPNTQQTQQSNATGITQQTEALASQRESVQASSGISQPGTSQEGPLTESIGNNLNLLA